MIDETRLEEAFRTGLQHRADDVDTAVDLLGPARSAARGRRRRTWAAGSVGLAAAALVTVAVVQSVGEEPDRGTPVADTPSEPLPTQWRTEAWHGLQVEVPADWAWGSAPIKAGHELIRCGGPTHEPYVGRPVATTDVCQGVFDETPTAPYVWLGADVEVGVMKDLGGGYVQTTVEVEGTALTVATTDPRLTQRIVDSAEPVQGCEASLDAAPMVKSMLVEGLRNPQSAQVCAYNPTEDLSSWDLVYATALDAESTKKYHSQVYDGGFESRPDFCGDGRGGRVLITISGDDPYGGGEVTQATVVDPTCREVQGSPGMVSPLSDAGMAAWTQNTGVSVTLPAMIGPQG